MGGPRSPYVRRSVSRERVRSAIAQRIAARASCQVAATPPPAPATPKRAERAPARPVISAAAIQARLNTLREAR